MTLLEQLNKVPPMACRLLARTGPNIRQRPMSNSEIIKRAAEHGFHLSRGTVAKFSALKCWNTITAEKVQAWIVGTGIDPLNCRRHQKHLVRSKLAYMGNGTTSQKRMIDRMLPKASPKNGIANPPNGQVVFSAGG